MASSAEVYAALRIIGASCKGMGSGENWAMEVASTWAGELKHAQAKHVADAARMWIRTEERRPSLYNFLSVVKQARGQANVKQDIAGCEDCGYSGWRELVVHWLDARTNTRRAQSYTAPCECERGMHFAQSVDGFTVSKARRQFENMAGFIEIHVTDRERSAIPLALKVSPEQYQELYSKPKRRSLGWES